MELAARLLGGDPSGRAVTVLGGACKAGSDDVRDSPALDVAARLHGLGARVRVHDPRAGQNIRRTRPRLTVVDDLTHACQDSELVLVLTEWPEFAAIDPVALGQVVAGRTVIDGRLVLDPVKWADAGWELHALGRGRVRAGGR